jgi:hypothetical protein
MHVSEEIAIENRRVDGGRGRQTPHLIISLDCLANILMREEAVIAPDDVAGLLAVLCREAAEAGHGDPNLAAEQEAYYAAQVRCPDCDSQPCCCDEEEEDGAADGT